MKVETVKLNKAAMQFVDENCFAKVNTGEDKKPKLEMVAYSGGVIKNHWYWGDLAIDLSGMSFPKKKSPLLEDHQTDKKIGFATKMSIENNQLTVVDSVFLNTPESLAFQQNSSDGFPYEASIYAKPTTIEEVGEGDSTEVNGYTFKGPGTIWRKSTFKEASVCTFGYDPNTKSAVSMSEGEEEFSIEYTNKSEAPKSKDKEELKKMNVTEQFKTDHPEEYKALIEGVVADASQTFTVKITELELELKESTDENGKLSEENKGNEKRIMALEKEGTLRKEKELVSSADSVFSEEFKESGLPDRLSEKVRKLVSHEQFIKEGELDTEAFRAIVKTELKDWTNEEGGIVNGFSTSTKTFVKDDSGKDSDACVDRMLKHIGQETKK